MPSSVPSSSSREPCSSSFSIGGGGVHARTLRTPKIPQDQDLDRPTNCIQTVLPSPSPSRLVHLFAPLFVVALSPHTWNNVLHLRSLLLAPQYIPCTTTAIPNRYLDPPHTVHSRNLGQKRTNNVYISSPPPSLACSQYMTPGLRVFRGMSSIPLPNRPSRMVPRTRQQTTSGMLARLTSARLC